MDNSVSTATIDSAEEESDFSATVLSYIDQMLMEEDMDSKYSIFQDSLALQDAERSFYEVIRHNYPSSSSSSSSPSSSVHHHLQNYPSVESPDQTLTNDYSTFSSGSGSGYSTTSTSNTAVSQCDNVEYNYKPPTLPTTFPISPYFVFQSKSIPTTKDFLNRFSRNPISGFLVSTQLERGLEQGTVFPKKKTTFSPSFGKAPQVVIKTETETHEGDYSLSVSKGRKTREWEEHEAELQDERRMKQPATYEDDSELSELFDKVLLGTGLGKGTPPNITFQESGGNDKQVVDLRTLLMLGAQSVASDNLSYANKLLKQIKQHSSIMGDGTQRLAHYFGNALEARLTGTGFHVYSVLSNKINSAKSMIKAYQMYASVCPFEKLAIMFTNKSIWNLAKEAETLHIIDFGIGYGFKWPALINRISKRAGGPPKLRITGIELPQPGFRPEEKVKETGHRLASFCKRFNVPFEYNAIARRWETIKVEDLKIEKNEFVAVNCMFRFKNLFDEIVVVNNPRDAVLSLIKKANPDIFVHGIVNGCYDAPFFVTRFREALFHYSALFDMLDTNVVRENPLRLMFEKEKFGPEIMNIIACEGSERVERPETYKQWQLRNMRSGLRQLPLDHQIIDILRDRLRDDGHNTNFMLDVDGNWVLQGWKGRILHASSCWVPA